MNAVVFYSNTGQSKAVAEYFSQQLGYPLMNIEGCYTKNFNNLVLVFPVLCQSIPDIVSAFLQNTTVTYLTVIATYGKMWHGNVLYEIQRAYKKSVIAGAYIPTKHTYIENDDTFRDFDKLIPIIEKIKRPSSIRLPKLYKNPLADIFPKLRSRLGVKLYRTSACNNCNLCGEKCSVKAINSGITTSDCIRCLKCVDVCPNHALKVKIRLPLELYLQKKKVNKIIIYV